MIKKLFTLLTLALLAMPLAQALDDGFYLAVGEPGKPNDWTTTNHYQFSVDQNASIQNTTVYTLTIENLPACQFKIIKVVNGSTTWYGAGGINDNGDGTNHIFHGNNSGLTANGSYNFQLQSAGPTTFTFKYSGGDPYQLTVSREPKLSLRSKSSENNWNWNDGNEEPMTQTSTGWTISKSSSQWREFGFVDEFGQWRGGPDNTNIINLDGSNLGNNFALWTDGKQFKINTDQISNITISVNSNLTQTAIYESNTVYSKSLAFIEEYGVKDMTYTVNEPLQVVYVNTINNKVFARDLTGTTATPNGINYMTDVAKEPGSLEQYNWVMLDFTGTGTDLLTSLSAYPNPNPNTNKTNNNIALIQGLKGVYTDDNNYTIKVTDITTVSQGTAFTPNVYCPANFQVDANGCQTGYEVKWVATGNNAPDGTPLYNMEVGETPNAVTYWFMTPKPMEVFELSGALWCGDGFYMEGREYVPATTTEPIKPEKWYNPAGLKGGIGLDKSCNSTNSPDLTVGQSYRFLTVAWKKVSGSKSEASYDEPLRISLNPEPGSTLNTTIQAGAINLTGAADQIVTGVSEVKTGNEVVSVTYCDLAGRMSQKPFAGVNIIVTRYSDGTVKTTKAIK